MAKILDPETGETIVDEIDSDEAFGLVVASGYKHWLVYIDGELDSFQPWRVMS